MKQIRLIFILVLLFPSCKKKTEVLDYNVPDNLEVQTLPVTIDNENFLLYSNLYSKVEYIKLEATEQSLVGEVSKLIIMDNGDLIVLDCRRSSVIRFDENGKFICKMGKYGKGHGEYIAASDIAYDKYNKCVIILDEGGGKLVTYDMNGKYLSTTQLGCSPSAFTVLDEKHLCIYMNHFDNLGSHPIGHNLKILNRKGYVVSEFMEFDAGMSSFHPACDDTFFSMDSKTCFKQPYSSLIYMVDNGVAGAPTIVPELYIDFGENKIPQKWYQGNSWDLIDKLKESDGITYLASICKIKNRLFLNLGMNNKMYLHVVDLQNRSFNKTFFSSYNDMYGLVSSILIATTKENRCYYVIDPSEFYSYKKNIEEGLKLYTIDRNCKEKEYLPSQKDMELLNSIQDGDNPIIQVCTLKG